MVMLGSMYGSPGVPASWHRVAVNIPDAPTTPHTEVAVDIE